MSDESSSGTEYILKLRGGENCPSYRNKTQQRELLIDLVSEAMEKAATEHGLPAERQVIKTRYHQSSLEPQCSYAEVRVYDSWDCNVQADTNRSEGTNE
jgi:hypothetical protein